MSGDVQPRKRKDKKKKRDDESSHGVHITKMGTEDVHLHVHEEHGTGGHWCAKVIFFSLMTILLGLVCLIILENRGISDMDTPLSESRFSNYFDGWVDEHRSEHDDHHGDVHGSAEDDHDEHDDHDDEPFEEEADVSEGDEADDVDEDDNVTQEEAEEAGHDDDDNVTAEDDGDGDADADDDDDEQGDDEDDDEGNATAEADADDDDDNVTAEDDNVTAEEENVTAEEDNVTAENEAEDDDDENLTVEATTEDAYEEVNDDEEDDDNTTKEDDNIDENVTVESSKQYSKANDDDDDDDDDDGFDEDDDNGTYDSMENVVDNDAAELELLKEKARQQAATEAKNSPDSEKNTDDFDEAEQVSSWASSLTVKIGVGVALAFVARLVLLKKNPITNDEANAELLMKRRLTIASPEDDIPEDANEVAEPLPENDFSEEEIEFEEEIEIEEEIEYIDDSGEEPTAAENQVDAGENVYVPETFEQLNAMYRTKGFEEEKEEAFGNGHTHTRAEPESQSYRTHYQSNANTYTPMTTTAPSNNIKAATSKEETFVNGNRNNGSFSNKAPAMFETSTPSSLPEAKVGAFNYSTMNSEQFPPKNDDFRKLSTTESGKKFSPPKEQSLEQETSIPRKKETTYDMDYQPKDDDIDYDEDDIYDDEEGDDDDSEELDDDDLLDDEEEDDEEDVSDVDDTELMNRLEAKYGKLPAKEYESDQDPEDPTWTQIKPKTGGGPQSYEADDDLFEQELRRTNEEMMREFNYY